MVDHEANTRNDVTGSASQLVQAGRIAGDVHLHPAPYVIPVPRQLPLQPAHFTGQDAELSRLDSLLSAQTERAGLGGRGYRDRRRRRHRERRQPGDLGLQHGEAGLLACRHAQAERRGRGARSNRAASSTPLSACVASPRRHRRSPARTGSPDRSARTPRRVVRPRRRPAGWPAPAGKSRPRRPPRLPWRAPSAAAPQGADLCGWGSWQAW